MKSLLSSGLAPGVGYCFVFGGRVKSFKLRCRIRIRTMLSSEKSQVAITSAARSRQQLCYTGVFTVFSKRDFYPCCTVAQNSVAAACRGEAAFASLCTLAETHLDQLAETHPDRLALQHVLATVAAEIRFRCLHLFYSQPTAHVNCACQVRVSAFQTVI